MTGGLLPRVSLNAGVNRYSSSFRGFSDSAGDAPPVRSTNVALSRVQPLSNRAAALARDQGPLQAELGEVQWLQARADLDGRSAASAPERAPVRAAAARAEDRSPAVQLQRVLLGMAEDQVAQTRAPHAPVVEFTASCGFRPASSPNPSLTPKKLQI